MKTAIIIFFLIGMAMCTLAKWQGDKASNPDDWSYAFVMIGGWISLGIAVVLTVGYGLYRLFTS